MQAGRVTPCFSTDGTDFTAALVQNAVQQADIQLPSEIGGIGTTANARIRDILIWSSDNLAWVIQYYEAHNARSADPNKDTFVGQWKFATTDAVQDPTSGLWRYSIDKRDIRYTDGDKTGMLHVVLVNTSAAAKGSYGAGSHFRLCTVLEAAWGG